MSLFKKTPAMSTRLRSATLLAALTLGSALLTGCGRSQSNPDQTTWLVTPERTGAPHAKPVNLPIKMGAVSANSPFDGKSLICRVSENRFEKDFYNVYLVYPRDMVANATRQWLVKSNAFNKIIEQSSVFFPEYQLQGVIDELYGDYRGTPEAVVTIQFYASSSISASNYIFSSPRITKRVALKNKSPQALIDGQQQALAEVLAELETRLIADSVNAPAPFKAAAITNQKP